MDAAVLGQPGVLIVGTRGDSGAGEVTLSIRGATETYLAWSAQPLPRGTRVVVMDALGPRTVRVESADELMDNG